MTQRQRSIWSTRLAQREQGLLDYYKRHPDKKPDGSFMMNALLRGYQIARREGAKLQKQSAV